MSSQTDNPEAQQRAGRADGETVESGDTLTTAFRTDSTMQQQPLPAQDSSNQGITERKAPNRFFSHIVPVGPRNIIIFGETGTGKSSLINMLSNKEVAPVSSDATGCTFEARGHVVTIGGAEYNLWDTAGLNEGEAGSVPGDQALQHLSDLVKRLEGGLSLLVYCIRGSRYRDILKVNYDLFTRIICQREIPVVIVVTGLENEEPMEKWWDDNKEDFSRRGMAFEGHACITTTRGKKDKEGIFVFEKEYNASRVEVQNLIRWCCPGDAWVVDSELWLDRITASMVKYYSLYNSRSSPEETVKFKPLAVLYSFIVAALTRLYYRTGKQLKSMWDNLLSNFTD